MAHPSSALPRKLWENPNPKGSRMYAFMQGLNDRYNLDLQTFRELYDFSLNRRTDFWAALFDSAGYIYEGDYRPSHGGGGVVDESLTVDAVPEWFKGVRLNFAENILYNRADPAGFQGRTDLRTTRGKEDHAVAVTAVREGGADTRKVTWGEVRARAAQMATAMAKAGVGVGDRVVLVGAVSTETLIVWLATCWLGALFSSSSTDTGAKGILQRAVQVNPKLVFFDDATVYNAKTTDLRDKMAAVVRGLESCTAFRQVVSIPRFDNAPRDITAVPKAVSWADFLSGTSAADALADPPPFARVPFSDPFLVCFSSGTTGAPKAIVHSVGGLMLNYFKEACLHEGLGPGSVSFQYTTTGWIMYVATVAALLFSCHTILYDGSPFVPDRTVLARVAGEHRATKMGISPRWLLEMARNGISPREVADLSSLTSVTCTGMVLSDELQHWFYDKGFPKHVHLANISGGTDIAGCFGISNPLTPLYVGGSQGPSLGVDVRKFDSAAEPESPGSEYAVGREVAPDEPGELVAVKAFPNVPCFFWADPGSGRVTMDATTGRMIINRDKPAAPPGSRYHDAYFARFRGVWAHGDFVLIHPDTGAVEFLGRSDGVLNPSGVRFGSAEIYAVMERNFADVVADSLCVGQRRPGRDSDESVLLFLQMRPDAPPFNAELEARIRTAVERELSKRHVPRYIFTTPAIPTTVNMKKVELPVKRILCGEKITPSGTLANPESLDYYYQFVEVEKLAAQAAKPKL